MTHAVLCLVAQPCLILCSSMNCILPGSSVHRDSPGKNIRVGCHALLQGIFPTQGLNPGLLHCKQILYHLRHQGSLHRCYNLKECKHILFLFPSWLLSSHRHQAHIQSFPTFYENLILIPNSLLKMCTTKTFIKDFFLDTEVLI